MDAFDFSINEEDAFNAIGTYKSRGVKGDCERFRLQMKISKARANDSRIEEVMVEGLYESLHEIKGGDKINLSKIKDENVIVENDKRIHKDSSIKMNIINTIQNIKIEPGIERNIIANNDGIECNNFKEYKEKSFFASAIMNRSSNSSLPYENTSSFEGKNNHQNNAHEDFKARKRIKTYNNFSSYSNTTNSSTSSSESSLSSLPLSHYVQKLKYLAPISRRLSNPATNINNNSTIKDNLRDNTSINTAPSIDIVLMDYQNVVQEQHDHNTPSIENSKVLTKSIEDEKNMQVDIKMKNHINNTFPNSNINNLVSLSSTIYSKSNTHVGIFAGQKSSKLHTKTLKDNNEIVDGKKSNEKVAKTAYANTILPYEKNSFIENISKPNNDIEEVRQLTNFNKDNKFVTCEDASLQQVMFNELRGLIESFNSRFEVETKSLKICFEDLKKQLDYLRHKMSKEIFEARQSLQNDIELKLKETVNSLSKNKKMNDDETLLILEKTIVKHQFQSDIGILALKSEMKQLWNEIKELSKNKNDIQSYLVNFIYTTSNISTSIANNECNMLKSENNELIKQLQNFKENNLHMKIENVQRLVEKAQENNAKLEKNQNIPQTKGIQERMLIMERLENLSQFFLGGLEVIRSNVSNIKTSFRDRVDELEGQWIEHKHHQECNAAKSHHTIIEHMLVNELQNIRNEVAKIVEIEREHLKEKLERENVTIQRHFVTMCTTNKREILNTIKGDLNKQLQSAQNKISLMTNAMKQDMDHLRSEIREGQNVAEYLSKKTSVVGEKIETTIQAAAEATTSATEAKDMSNEMHKSFEVEIANVQRNSLQLQKNLTLEKDMVQSVVNEACRTREELSKNKEKMYLVPSITQAKKLELNELVQKESSNILEAVSAIHEQRDIAFQAAKEAKHSAIKSSEVFAKVLNSFNREMTKAQHLTVQLLKGFQREKEGIERERQNAIQYNQEAHDWYSKELELAITSWKHDMDVEITKAREVTHGLEKEQRQAMLTINQTTMLYPLSDCIRVDMKECAYKTQEAIDHYSKLVHQLQDAQDNKHQRFLLKTEELEQFQNNWQIESNQLQQMTRVLEEKFKESLSEQSTLEKRIKMVEDVQVNLVRSYEDVQNSTGDFGKTTTIWLPKYEAAVEVVNEISSKAGHLDEQIHPICGNEILLQQISCLIESKFNEMKEMVISVLENRVTALEKSMNQDSNLSLKLEYAKKNGKEGEDETRNISSFDYLSQNVEALQRKVENITTKKHSEIVTLEMNGDFSSKVIDLENRIEHVASATFENLRLLDKEVEHVTKGVQSTLDGVTLVDKKCVFLGSELVKVFRMFTSKKDVQGFQNDCFLRKQRNGQKNSRSPLTRQHINERQDIDSHIQPTTDGVVERIQEFSKILENHQSFPIKTNITPQKIIKRGMSSSSKDVLHTNAIHLLQTQKPTLCYKRESNIRNNDIFENGSPSKDEASSLQDSSTKANECKLQGPPSVVDEHTTVVDIGLDGRLIIEKRQDGLSKNCQRTNICFKTSRIHVNVSHQSNSLNQISKKRNEMIAIQA